MQDGNMSPGAAQAPAQPSTRQVLTQQAPMQQAPAMAPGTVTIPQRPAPGTTREVDNPFDAMGLNPRQGENDPLFTGTMRSAPVELPGGITNTKYKSGITQYSDPFYHDPTMTENDRQAQQEAGLDSVQPWLDKMGNGIAKMAGSFMNGVLSTAGTIYGMVASPISYLTGNTHNQLWDNPFSRLGDDIDNNLMSSFTNYRSLSEQSASAWSPKYWARWNFFADNVIGNLGFAVAGMLTGTGFSAALEKLTPWIVSNAVDAGLGIAEKEGFGALLSPMNVEKAAQAAETWGRTQQMLSLGLSGAGESSTEATQTKRETKKMLSDAAAIKYGGADRIPQSVLDKIEEDSNSAGDRDYIMNLPIIMAADAIMWGKSLAPVKAEIQAFEDHPIQVIAKKALEGYTQVEPEKKSLFHTILEHSKEVGAEALQEGEQYFAQQGTENWYQRNDDPGAWNAVHDYMDPYMAAAKTLFTTQEGVANLLGGAFGGAPFGMMNYIKEKVQGKKDVEIGNEELQRLNDPFGDGSTIKDKMKLYVDNLARHTSSVTSLNEALARGDTHGIRNAKYDILKSFVNSRIMTGRTDLLNAEITQMRQMNNDEFTTWLGLDPATKYDKNVILDHLGNTAQEMANTWHNIDTVFNYNMARLNKLPKEEQTKKKADLDQYKMQLWNYMSDYKDRDKRAKQLDTEVQAAFGNLMPINDLMMDKFGSNHELNDLYRQYVAAHVENTVSAHQDATYDGSAHQQQIQSLQGQIKAKINKLTEDNPAKFLKMEDLMGPEKKDYVENYLFNFNKSIAPALNNPIVQASMSTADLHNTYSKLQDLVELHTERRLAIHSYNQLANMIKTGDYMNHTMANPAYNEEKHGKIPEYNEDDSYNKEYVPKYIPSDKMLRYNGYARNENERKNFYRDLEIKNDANSAEEVAFKKEMDEQVSEEETITSKPFHDRANQYINGSADIIFPGTATSLRSMNDEELQQYSKSVERENIAHSLQGTFATHTAKLRASFDKARYIDTQAKLKAINGENDIRRKIYDGKVEDMANSIVDYFNTNPKIVVDGVERDMTLDDIKEGMMIGNIKINNPDIIDRAKEIVGEREKVNEAIKRKADAIKLASLSQGKIPDRDEPIIDDDTWGRTTISARTGERILSASDRTGVGIDIIPNIAAKIRHYGMNSLNDRELAIYKGHKAAIDKRLGGDVVAALTAQPKQVQTLIQVEPVISPDPERQATNISIGLSQAGKVGDRISYQTVTSSFIGLRRSDLEYDRDTHENVYDSNNNVIRKQLQVMSNFTNPLSPLNFNNRPAIRAIVVKDDTNKNLKGANGKEDLIELQASPDGGKTWIGTGYELQGHLDVDGQPIKVDNFDTVDEKNNELLVQNYKDELTLIRKEATDNPEGIRLIIRNEPGFGKLIKNKLNDAGLRTTKSIWEVSGGRINDTSDPSSVQLGVFVTDADKNANTTISFWDHNTASLDSINNKPRVNVDQRLIDATANGSGAIVDKPIRSQQSAGQIVMNVPIGRLTKDPAHSAYEYFPVLISGALLNAHTSTAYNSINKGAPANMGEILIDALLNPWKPEHDALMKQLMEFSGLAYKGHLSDWSAFYNNDRIGAIINKLFFSSSKGMDKTTEYVQPFRFELQYNKGGGVLVKIDIKIPGTIDSASAELYLTNKDGSLKMPTEAGGDFVQDRINDRYKERKDKKLASIGNISYEDIRNVIRNKAFHVQIAPLSENSRTAPIHTGFHLDDEGKLGLKQYDNYFKYLADLKLAETTVQSVEQNGARQFFVNQPVYFERIQRDTVKKIPATVITGKQTIVDPLTAAFGPATSVTTEIAREAPVAKPAKSKTVLKGMPTEAAIKSQDASVGIKSTIAATPNRATSTKEQKDAERERRANMQNKGKPGSGMINFDVVTSISQYNLKFGGSPGAVYAQAVTEELAGKIMDRLLMLRSKGPVYAQTIKADLLNEIQKSRYALMQKARPILANVTMEEWNKIDNRDDPKYGLLHTKEISKLSSEELKQYDALDHAILYDDIDRFIALDKAGKLSDEMRMDITYGSGTLGFDEEGNPKYYGDVFFMGYLNRALLHVMQSNIIQVSNKGNNDEVDIDNNDGNYTQRYNDMWALQINPKNTLGMQSKLLLNNIPRVDITIDEDGNIISTISSTETGFAPRLKYDAIYNQVVNIGLESTVLDFEGDLMNSRENDSSAALYSLRKELLRIKAGSIVKYNQLIQQLATNVLSLRKNGMYILNVEKNDVDHNAKAYLYSTARTDIGAQIIATWKGQFLNQASLNNFTGGKRVYDTVMPVTLKQYSLNDQIPVKVITKDGIKTQHMDFADAYNTEITQFFKRAGTRIRKYTFDDYVELAKIIKNRLGIQLTEGDFGNRADKADDGFKTATALQGLTMKIPGKRKTALGYLIAKDPEIQQFQDIFTVLLGKYVANNIRDNIKEGIYNPDDPFINSVKALDTLTKLFKAHHMNVSSSQSRNVDGENENTLIMTNMLNEQMKRLQDEAAMREFAALPMGKYNYYTGIGKYSMFAETDPFDPGETLFRPSKDWTDKQANLVNGVKIADNGKGRNQKSQGFKKNTDVDIDIASALMYGNNEKMTIATDSKGIPVVQRGTGWYYTPFGDSTAGSMISDKKHYFTFDYSGGRVTINKGGGNRIKDWILYGSFKSEVHSIRTNLDRFNQVNNNPNLSLEDKKAVLDKDYDYIQVGNILRPGSGTKQYYFGKDNNNVTEGHPLFNTVTDSTGTYATGLKESLLNGKEYNDAALFKIFEGQLNDTMSTIVNAKMAKLTPYLQQLFALRKPTRQANGKFLTPRWKTNFMDNEYTKSVINTFARDSTVDGKPIMSYGDRKEKYYDSLEDAMNNGYHMQLLKAMVIDQQLNHFAMMTNFKQMTWDLAQFDNKQHNWKSFMDNVTKYDKGYNSPRGVSVSIDNVQSIVFNDIFYGQRRMEVKNPDELFTKKDKELFAFMAKHDKVLGADGKPFELAKWLEDGKVPVHYEELTKDLHYHKEAGKSDMEIAKILKDKLESKITDGGSFITLRDHLYQKFIEGRITSDEYFRLHKLYKSFDKVITGADRQVLHLPGEKMLATGLINTGNRLAGVYIKDGKMTMLPAQVRNGKFRDIVQDLHDMEDRYADPEEKTPTPGWQLIPLSTVKQGNPKVIDLFDKDGNVNPFVDKGDGVTGNTVVRNAVPFVYKRKDMGRQVENPEKNVDDITVGAQLQDFIFNGMSSDVQYAVDKFGAMPLKAELGSTGTIITGTVPDRFLKDKDKAGLSGKELHKSFISVIRRLHETKLQQYINEYGLTYDISNEWRKALEGSPYKTEKEFQEHIDDLTNENHPEYSIAGNKIGEHLNYVKNEMIVNVIDKMTADIRNSAAARNIDLGQLAVLNEKIKTSAGDQLKLSLTFTPGNKQYQSLVISKIQGLVRGVKRHGTSNVQASSIIFDKKDGTPGLKGEGLLYDKDGDVAGWRYAEIAVPWRFKDAGGKLLDFSKYCDKDGVPIEGRISDELLNLVNYRIPNTGINMASITRIARFLQPSYGDMTVIPDALYSRMGLDNDFDKMYNYNYNHSMDSKGNLSKVEGVLNMKQHDAFTILNTEEGINHVIDSMLMAEDPNYARTSGNVNTAYMKLMDRIAELEDSNDVKEDNYAPTSVSQLKGVDADAIKNRIKELTGKEFVSKQERKALDKKAQEEKDNALTDPVTLLQKQYADIIQDFNALQGMRDERRSRGGGFDMRRYLLDRPDNYLNAQSYEQLENAYIDVYHHILKDQASQSQMTTPVTTDSALDYINTPRKEYGGKSFRELKEGAAAQVPNSEVYQTNNASMNNTRAVMVGALANSFNAVHLLQQGHMSVGAKVTDEDDATTNDAIAFNYNNKKQPIEETGKEEGRFTSTDVNARDQRANYYANPMVLNGPQKTFMLPNRLDRIYDNEGEGRMDQQMLSILQAFLDGQKTPEIVYSNINTATINVALAMNNLGYRKQLIPFLQQEIIEDYARADRSTDSSFTGNKRRVDTEVMDKVIYDVLTKAGVDISTFKDLDMTAAEILNIALKESKRGTAAHNYDRYFSEKDLYNMIGERFAGSVPDQEYYLNQAFVLNMFLRLREVGDQIFNITRRTALKNQGYKNKSLLGMEDAHDKFNALAQPMRDMKPVGSNIIGSERIGPWSPDSNPDAVSTTAGVAFQYAKKAGAWLYNNHNLFSNLKQTFVTMRTMLSDISEDYTLDQKERSDINAIRYILSNPDLYQDFLDVIPEEDRLSAHDIRKHVMIDEWSYDKEGEPEQILAPSLARMINFIGSSQDEDTGMTYAQRYPVLDYFKTSVKSEPGVPSWVYNFNSNNFRERVGQESASNIFDMLSDPNPDVQEIAKKLYLYHYLSAGVTTPQSFGHLLAQEFLLSKGGFADKLAANMSESDEKYAALAREVKMKSKDAYEKPKWFRPFDKDIVTTNIESSKRLLAYYTQNIQNNIFNAIAQDYTVDQHFEEVGDNIVRLLPAGQVMSGEESINPASFLDTDLNVYIINRDYDTYTRYNRAGVKLYNEYDTAMPYARTLLANNEQRFNERDKVAGESAEDGESELQSNEAASEAQIGDDLNILAEKHEPYMVDKPNSAQAMMQYEFNNPHIDIGSLADESKILELQQLMALAKVVIPFIPGGLNIIPKSVARANKDSNHGNRDTGMVTVLDNGQLRVAMGKYTQTQNDRTGYAPGEIEIAYGYIQKQVKEPLLLKQVLLHETVHAAYQNVHNLVRAVVEKTMTRERAIAILSLKGDADEFVGRFMQMEKAYKKNKLLYEHLTEGGYKILQNAYRAAAGGKESDADFRLKNIMASQDEFVARIFNDKGLRDALAKVEYKDRNALLEILKYIAQLFGLDKDHALYHAFNNIFTMLEPVSNSKIGGSGFTIQDLSEIAGETPTQKAAKANAQATKPVQADKIIRQPDPNVTYVKTDILHRNDAMVAKADGIIAELATPPKAMTKNKNSTERTGNFKKNIKYGNSDSDTSMISMYKKLTITEGDHPYEPTISHRDPIYGITPLSESNKVIMLTRDTDFYDKPLNDNTKNAIRNMKALGATFIVKDVAGLDTQFIDYLKEIGAKYTIYHVGEKSNIDSEQGLVDYTSEPPLDITTAAGQLQYANLKELYRGSSNIDVETALPEEMQLYDRLVKNNQIIC